jgi:hypothetical protein
MFIISLPAPDAGLTPEQVLCHINLSRSQAVFRRTFYGRRALERMDVQTVLAFSRHQSDLVLSD